MPSYEPINRSRSKSKSTKVNKWTRKKWIKNRDYSDKAICDRNSILFENRFKNQVKITKRIVELCLTFGFGLHRESEYILLKKNKKTKKSGWQKKLLSISIPFEDLKSLFKHTEERELNQIAENSKKY